jgi:hypothetical protein
MGNPTVNDSATYAKYANREAEACAQVALMVATSGANFPYSDDCKMSDDEFREWCGPLEPAPAPRRQRQRSLASTLKAARKAGADRAIVDGVVIALSPAAAAPEPTASEWDVVLQGGDHGEH